MFRDPAAPLKKWQWATTLSLVLFLAATAFAGALTADGAVATFVLSAVIICAISLRTVRSSRTFLLVSSATLKRS